MENLSFTTNQDIIALLCQRLKEYRLAARISQREMAEKSGLSLTTISHLEQGLNRNITLNNFTLSCAIPSVGPFDGHAFASLSRRCRQKRCFIGTFRYSQLCDPVRRSF